MVYLGGTSRKHCYGGAGVGSKECKPVYTVHYLVSFHCGHLGFSQFSRRGGSWELCRTCLRVEETGAFFHQLVSVKCQHPPFPDWASSCGPRGSSWQADIADHRSRKLSVCIGTGSAKGIWVGYSTAQHLLWHLKGFSEKMNSAFVCPLLPFLPKEFAPGFSQPDHEGFLCVWVQRRKIMFSFFLFVFVRQERSKRGPETVARSWLYRSFGNH